MSSVTSPAAKTPGMLVVGRARLGQEVAARLHVELAGEEFSRGLVADGDEDAVGLEVRGLRRYEVLQPQMGDGGGVLLPQISSTAEFQTTSIFGCLNRRSCRMRSARKQSRRWTRVTLEARLAR